MTLKQRYQQVEGTVQLGVKTGELRDVKLEGDHIAFSVFESPTVQRDYAGRVSGSSIEGTVKYQGGEAKWSARRVD